MEETRQRIDRLERLVADLDGRVTLLEQPAPARPAPARPVPARPVPARPAPPRPAPARPAPPTRSTIFQLDFGRDDLEDLVGGRVLAWVGGLAVLLGIVFLFALAISNGWIGETARVAIGAAGSAGLLALGVWLHERKARTDAALASVATGISGLFITITVAAQVYELLPQLIAVVFAVGVGAVATALALRWESRGIAVLGILGALAAPVLTGVAGDGGTMVILFVALASAAGVLLWQRWDWLALSAFAVATPQWIAYLVEGPPMLAQLAVLVGFGSLGMAVAIGHDVRVHAERLRSSSAYLLALNAIVVAAVGWLTLGDTVGEDAANAWLAAVSLVHLGVGLSGRRVLSNDLRLLVLVIGAVIADVASGLIADGPALAIGWAVTGVGFAALVRRGPGSAGSAEGVLAQAGLGGHLGLSLLSSVAVSDPVPVIHGYEPLSAAGAAAVAALAAGCLVSARIAGEKHQHWGTALDTVGLGAVGVLTAMSLDGLQLVFAWIVEAVALAAIARRTYDEVAALGALGFLALAMLHVVAFEAPPESLATGLAGPAAAVAALLAVVGCLVLMGAWAAQAEQPRLAMALRAVAVLTLLYLTALTLDGLQLVLVLTAEVVALAAIGRLTGDEVAHLGALGFVALAAIHAVVYEAPPVSLVTGLADPAAAVAALSAIGGCLVLLAAWTEPELPEFRTALRALAALTLLYLASTAVVTPFESDSAVDSALLSAHQQGQMVLSVFWGLVGVGTVVVGLRRDLAVVRIAGLALLGVAVTKVFLFDLAMLTSVYRVVSFIGLGLLLLSGALVWQRLRPQAPADLRQTPAGVR